MIRILRLAILSTILLALAAGGAGAQQTRPNGAGLVVRHGDGTLIYAYVEFEGETISGEELLLRSGLDLIVTPFAGIGTGVCMIDGEGCQADDCWCESYSTPAYYWHYYGKSGDGWATEIRGPTVRHLGDGDIDGWSWTGGEHGLPAVTIDEIAALTGFDRSPPPTPTPEPPLPAPSTATASATPTAQAAMQPPGPSQPAQQTSTSTSAPTATAIATASSTSSPTPTPALLETPTAIATDESRTTALPASQPSPASGSGAVVVEPGELPRPLDTSDENSGSSRVSLLLFSGFALALAGAGAVAVLRRQRGGTA